MSLFLQIVHFSLKDIPPPPRDFFLLGEPKGFEGIIAKLNFFPFGDKAHLLLLVPFFFLWNITWFFKSKKF